MKFFIALTILFCANSSWALSGREAWKVATTKGRAELLSGYQTFFQELAQKESSSYEDWIIKKSSLWSIIVNEAWAAGNMDCIYAGWPSRRVSGLCSSPARNNPDYQNGSCSGNEMQCQPMLFGKGLCVPTSTKEQRNLAFSNCNKKFQSAKRSLDSVIKEIQADGKENELLELIDFADRTCSSGKQAGTGMCQRLKSIVDEMRHYANALPKKEETVVVAENKIQQVTPEIKSEEAVSVTPVETQQDLKAAVESASQGLAEVAQASEVDCDPEVAGEVFDREEPRPFDFEYKSSSRGPGGVWDVTFKKDKNDPTPRPTGFKFRNVGPNSIAGDPIDPKEKVEREWSFVSDDNSRRETYLWITDDAGSGYLSQLMESVILIIPRNIKPSIQEVNGEVHVTLTTGEKVVYDKATKQVKSGVLSEGPVDLNPNRFNRKFAPITYKGTGISIRVDKRGEDPRLGTGSAVVTQNGKTCQVPARELWNAQSDFRYPNDKGLVDFLNKKCGNKFDI